MTSPPATGETTSASANKRTAPNPNAPLRVGMLNYVRNWLWGYDFFISYHWASGGAYAEKLALCLREKKYDVFLDRAEYAMGEDWLIEGRRALANTQRLVLIGTREALSVSDPVYKEVTAFTARSRLIVPIYFTDELSAAERTESRVAQLIPATTLFVAELLDNQTRGPSDQVLAKLVHTHQVFRRRSLRATMIGIAFLLLTLATIITAVQRSQAVTSRNNLAQQLAAVEDDRADAESQPGNDPRIAFSYALRAAQVAPANDPRRATYIDRALFLATQQPNRTIHFEEFQHEPIRYVISPDLQSLLVVTNQCNVEGWDLRSGERRIVPFRGTVAGSNGDPIEDQRDYGAQSLQISPDSRFSLVLMNSPDPQKYQFQLCIWEITTGKLLEQKSIEEHDAAFAYTCDSQAVLQSAPIATDGSSSERKWSVVWNRSTSAKPTDRTPATEPIEQSLEIVYRANRPAKVLMKTLADVESNPRSPDLRSQRWAAARESADGKRIVCVASTGYAAIWKTTSPHPFVQRTQISPHLAVAVDSNGRIYTLESNGTLSCSTTAAKPTKVKIRNGELAKLEATCCRLSADESRLILWYRGVGPNGIYDERGGFELRAAGTLELLAERRDAIIPTSSDFWVQDLAWKGGVTQDIVIAERGSDSGYLYIKSGSLAVVPKADSERLQSTPSEFIAFTADGRYAVLSRSRSEVSLLSTEKNFTQALGTFRFSGENGQEKLLWRMLSQAAELRQTEQGIVGKLKPGGAEVRLVAEANGAQIFVNGNRVAPGADALPVVWSFDANRWLSFGGDSTRLIDAETSYVIGEVPVSLTADESVSFVRGNSTVIGLSNKEMVTITTSAQLAEPPTWFANMVPAITGLVMDGKRNLHMLPPAELASTRKNFLQALAWAAAAGDQQAKWMHAYFQDP